MTDQAARLKEKIGATGAASTALENQPPKLKTFDDRMQDMAPALREALPENMTVERFSRMILTLYNTSPELRDCTPGSVLGSALQAAQLGLMLGSLDQAYLVPFKNFKGYDNLNKPIKKMEAQLIIGYKGYFELGYRTGKISHIQPGLVYASDEFEFEYGSNEHLKHSPKGLERDEEEPTHYYITVHMNNGRMAFLVRSFQQLYRHAAKHSNMLMKDEKNGGKMLNPKSNYVKNRDAMFLKTVARQLFQTLQLTTDIMVAMGQDGTIKTVDDDRVSKNMAEEVIDITDYTSQDVTEEEPRQPEQPAASAPKQEQPAAAQPTRPRTDVTPPAEPPQEEDYPLPDPPPVFQQQEKKDFF